ncbi:MAG TPA: Trk system potassium transporter TrkA [Clostridiales bacterium]|nr:Trk system potassium transporter TrkA [Clostridiales bacterium]
MKILIAGSGKLGETLARQLCSEEHDVTLVDSDRSVLESGLNRYDVMGVMGNCASMEVLRQAGVENADLLIAVTGSDEVNLLTCTTAHYINPKLHTIARIRNPDYAEQAYSMRDAFALSMIVNPERQAATEIERLLRYPGFLKRDTFAKGRMEIVELKLEADSRLCNVTLSSLNTLVRCRVLVCAVLRGGNAIAPDGNFVLHAGDRIFVTAPTEVLSELLKNLGVVTHRAQRVMLIGGGKISYYLAQALEESRLDIQLVEKDPEVCEQMAKALPRTTVIQGDAADRSVLEGEGLASCDALVTLTGLDELNMVISLYGSGFGVKQIITKVGRMEDGRVLDSLPLGSVICPRKLSCSTIVRYVRAMQKQAGAAITVHTIADGQVEAIEFPVDEHTLHCGEPLKKLKLRENILLVGINRGDHTEIPNGDSSFELGDSVVVVSSGATVLMQLNDIFA